MIGSARVCVAILFAAAFCESVSAVADFRPDQPTGAAIQRAINQASAAGGGRVVLDRAVYPSGTLYLKSNVELYLSEGAVILGGTNPGDYDDVTDACLSKSPERTRKAFVVCTCATNVSIVGGGTIDGRGVAFYDTSKRKYGLYERPSHPRPRMLVFGRCHNVRLADVTLKDSPAWTCWFRMCEDVSAERVKIEADQLMINNDGFHVDGCRRVSIRKCSVRTGDDSIVMRATQSKDGESSLCEDLLVEDCVLSSNCQCIRLGFPSDGTIRNGIFRRLKMSGFNGIASTHPFRALVGDSTGSCRMSNLLVEDCEIDVRNYAIVFWVEPEVALGDSYGSVTFRNIRLTAGRQVHLCGGRDTLLRNVRLENVTGTVTAEKPILIHRATDVSQDGFAVSCRGRSQGK